jgi:hypothetical protein
MNLELCKLKKIFRKSKIPLNDWEAFKIVIWKRCSHKIHHRGERSGIDSYNPFLFCQLKAGKWEGTPTVFQSGYQGAFPSFS